MTPAGVETPKPRLPIKQLAILSLCRFAEPLMLTSIFPYLPEMIESMGVPQAEIPKWGGIISMTFPLAQAATAIGWGRLSDSLGRKPALLIGLWLNMLASLLFGFSKSLPWAIATRILAGAGNGNVGIPRTMVAEIVTEKVLQPMAFSIMPIIGSLGSCFGPSIGGSLANPTRQFPQIFGGSQLLETFKFALPNLASAAYFVATIIIGYLFMKETQEGRRSKNDRGRVLGQKLVGACRGRPRRKTLDTSAEDQEVINKRPLAPNPIRRFSTVAGAPTWAQVCTLQSMLNVLSYTLLALHTIAFDQMVPVLLHFPVVDHSPEKGNVSLPFKFIGGFSLDSGRIGTLFTATGIIGVIAQFAIFPRTAKYLGVLQCMQITTFGFAVVYLLVPYCVLLETDQGRQAAVFILILLKALMYCFSYPCITILLTNSARSVGILGVLNGLSVATSAIGRASGPFIGGSAFTYGVKKGYLVLPWFVLAFVALCGHVLSWYLKDLPGPTHKWDDEEEEEEEQPTAASVEAQVIGRCEIYSGQETNLLVSSANAQATKAYFDVDEVTIGEESPLLGSASMSKTVSRDGISVGGSAAARLSGDEDEPCLPSQASSSYGTLVPSSRP